MTVASNSFKVLLLLMHIVLYFLVGDEPSMYWVIYAHLIFFAITVSYFKPMAIIPGLSSRLRIELLFSFGLYVFLLFPYTLFMLGLYDIEHSKYVSNVYLEEVNRGLLLLIVGVLSFSLGSKGGYIATGNKRREEPNTVNTLKAFRAISLGLLCLITPSVVSNILPLLLIGSYSGSSTGTVTLDAIFLVFLLLVNLITLSTSLLFWLFRIRGILSLISIVLFFAVALVLLLIGDRNSFFLLISLPILVRFLFYKKISLSIFFLGIFMSFFVYRAVEVSRMSQERSLENLLQVMWTGSDESEYSEPSFNITAIGLRAGINRISSWDDFFWGRFKLVSLSSLVPYSSRLFMGEETDITGSSEALKDTMIGLHRKWGTGTNIITDAYLDFGVFGVVIQLFFLGFVARRITINALRQGGVYLMLLPLMIIYYAQFPRYSLDFPLRAIIWTALLFKLSEIITKIKFR